MTPRPHGSKIHQLLLNHILLLRQLLLPFPLVFLLLNLRLDLRQLLLMRGFLLLAPVLLLEVVLRLLEEDGVEAFASFAVWEEGFVAFAGEVVPAGALEGHHVDAFDLGVVGQVVACGRA